MKKYFLKITKTYFYDPHGTADDGGTIKEVVNEQGAFGVTTDGTYIDTNDYQNYLENKSWNEDEDEDYNGDGEDENNEEDLPYHFYLEPEDFDSVMDISAQDGYNYELENYIFKEISEEEYYRYKEIINEYNKL